MSQLDGVQMYRTTEYSDDSKKNTEANRFTKEDNVSLRDSTILRYRGWLLFFGDPFDSLLF